LSSPASGCRAAGSAAAGARKELTEETSAGSKVFFRVKLVVGAMSPLSDGWSEEMGVVLVVPNGREVFRPVKLSQNDILVDFLYFFSSLFFQLCPCNSSRALRERC